MSKTDLTSVQDVKEETGPTACPVKMYPLHSLLPAQVRRRVKALKKLQLETLKLQAAFHKELHKLDARFQSQYQDAYSKRWAIVTGRVEPTDEECDIQEGYESPNEEDLSPEAVELRSKLSLTKEVEAGAVGVPGFWLTALKNSRLTSELVYPHDEPVLRHLEDIKVTIRDGEPMSFTLHFIFSPNPFFTSRTLTKQYIMRCQVDHKDPWSFDGPEMVEAQGCNIDWAKGMNVTLRTVQKKQRHKSKNGQVRTVVKTVQNSSFFNYFNNQVLGEAEYKRTGLLYLDFEVGSFIRERLIPRAVLFYTGEALDDDTSSEESDSTGSQESDSKDSFKDD